MTKYETLGARMLIQALSRQALIRPSRLLGHHGHRGLTPLRGTIVRELHGSGYSYPEIGHLMDRDASTVQYYANGKRRW